MPLPGIYPKKTKTLIWKDTCVPVFTAALFTIAKTWKQPKYPSKNERIKKIQDTHMHTHTNDEMLFSHKEEANSATWDNMDGIWAHYAKCSKSEKGKYCLVSLTHWILKKKKKKKTHRKREWICGYQKQRKGVLELDEGRLKVQTSG